MGPSASRNWDASCIPSTRPPARSPRARCTTSAPILDGEPCNSSARWPRLRLTQPGPLTPQLMAVAATRGRSGCSLIVALPWSPGQRRPRLSPCWPARTRRCTRASPDSRSAAPRWHMPPPCRPTSSARCATQSMTAWCKTPWPWPMRCTRIGCTRQARRWAARRPTPPTPAMASGPPPPPPRVMPTRLPTKAPEQRRDQLKVKT